jgi:hypothetical protein
MTSSNHYVGVDQNGSVLHRQSKDHHAEELLPALTTALMTALDHAYDPRPTYSRALKVIGPLGDLPGLLTC